MARTLLRRGAPLLVGALAVVAVIAVVRVSWFAGSRPVALLQSGVWDMPPGAQMLSGPVMPPNFESWAATKDDAAQPVLAATDSPAHPAVQPERNPVRERKETAIVPDVVHSIAPEAVHPPERLALPQHMARKHQQVRSTATKVVSGEVNKLLSSATVLRQQAAQMQAEARRRTTEAAEAEAVDRYLAHAQEELSAYGSNIKKLIDTSSTPARLHEQLKSFPKEAAELHALVDHSMSEADAAAVRITRAAAQPQAAHAMAAHAPRMAANPLPVPSMKAARGKHAQHRNFMSEGGQVLHAAAAKGVQPAESRHVAAVMKKLRAVKAFERAHLGGHAERKSRTQELVQPSPLIGAVNVANGEVKDGEPFLKYNASELGLEDEGVEAIEEHAATKDTPDTHAYLCNATCKDAIVGSVVGLTVKVASKCIPECAHGDYIMRTNGHPLPAWTTIDELKEQDETCTPDEEYQKCKLEALRPACNKVGDYVPEYCLINSHEGICNECRMLEEFAESKGLEFDLKEEGEEEEEEQECEEGEECNEEHEE